jgi:hypothetical protein
MHQPDVPTERVECCGAYVFLFRRKGLLALPESRGLLRGELRALVPVAFKTNLRGDRLS